MDGQINNPAKLRGTAIIALRAFIKALEMADGEDHTERYRYEFMDDGTKARIFVTATGETVADHCRPLEEWAKVGKQVRLAFIGLKDAKIELDEEAKEAPGTGYARYTLNVVTGGAYIERKGERLGEVPARLQARYELIKVQLPGMPATIEDWARVGREVEKPLFEELKQVSGFGAQYAESARAKMIARGIIRAPRTDDNTDGEGCNQPDQVS